MSKIDLTIIENTADLNKAIKSIATRGARLEGDIWRAAVSCAWHIKKDKQTTPLNNLLKALGKGIRANAVRAYAEVFMAVDYDKGSKTMKYNKDKTTDIEGAMKQSPFDFKPEPEYKPINLPESLSRLLKQVEKHVEANDPRDNIPSDMLVALRSLVPQAAE